MWRWHVKKLNLVSVEVSMKWSNSVAIVKLFSVQLYFVIFSYRLS